MLVSGAGLGVVFEKGRGLRERLPGRRLGDANDGDDGEGSSLTNTVDPRRGNNGAMAGVEAVGENVGVAELVRVLLTTSGMGWVVGGTMAKLWMATTAELARSGSLVVVSSYPTSASVD